MYTHIYRHFKRPNSWLIPVIFFASFFTSTRVLAQNVQAIEVRDTGFFEPGFYKVFFVDDYVVYESKIHTSSSKMISRVDSVTHELIFEDSLISTGLNSSYFVFHRDSSFGYRFSPNKMFLPPRIAVETGHKDVAGSNQFENLLSQKPDSSFFSPDSTELREVFLQPAKPDTPALRLVFSYSRKLNHLKHSLNKTLDAVKKLKLRKIEIVIAAFYDQKNKTNFPQYSFVTEMIDLPPVLPREIQFFLNWYKDIARLPSKGS
ncbi:MAG: hypothetical protein EOO10_00750 [Chitinophagaceae bacterium]|nr:MAG: hypothetical protein EOO10_00750 [Chitinophagaceae bacterium]